MCLNKWLVNLAKRIVARDDARREVEAARAFVGSTAKTKMYEFPTGAQQEPVDPDYLRNMHDYSSVKDYPKDKADERR